MTAEFEATLSAERFARYLEWRSGDQARALELYALNMQLSEALYTPLQILEITLRNRIHAVLTEARHEHWFEDDGYLLLERQCCQITEAAEQVGEHKDPTPGRIAAALWQKTLHDIARREDGKGLAHKDFSRPLSPIRALRNRVAHHEPIVQWDLPKHYKNILQLLRWLSPAAAEWCERYSRFQEVYPDERLSSRGPEGRVEHRPVKIEIRSGGSSGALSNRQVSRDFPSL